jgi:hypothetical protein
MTSLQSAIVIRQPMMFGMDTVTVVGGRAARSSPVVPAFYPGASQELATVLASITELTRADQRALAGAFKIAERAAQPLRITQRKTYSGFDDFMPAFNAARALAREAHGDRWHLNPDARMCARLPASWVSCSLISGKTVRSPRDVAFPVARFWPGEVLPNGPDYADLYAIDPSGDIRLAQAEREAAMARQMAEFPELFMRRQRRGWEPEPEQTEFEIEPSPDGEMDTSDLECVE